MIDPIIRWSLYNRAAVLAVALVLTLLGIYTARQMPVDVFPDLTAPTVTISPKPMAWRRWDAGRDGHCHRGARGRCRH